MSKSVLLLTDRPAFEEAWRAALERVGLHAQPAKPDALSEAIREGGLVVIDGACDVFDEDELLAHAGLARALKATCAIALPEDDRFDGIGDLLDDLCPGLVARSARDAARIAATLARRADRDRSRRFEYLAVSPRPSELLAILADGTAALLARPVTEADDGTEVATISLGHGAETATLVLANGHEVSLRASALGLSSPSQRPSAPPTNGHSAISIDGVRLGARLRELRVAAGLTQAELARRTGIHRPNIARVEAGRHTPSLETLARLASAIGVSTTTVLAEE
jgi:DNA-binding XRE family transcriptional regulator